MIGISSNNGAYLEDFAHLQQSVRDILTTPIGSRTLRRDYGSRLPLLVDQPFSASLLLNIYKSTAEALRLWEPRIAIKKISATFEDGKITLTMAGIYLPDGEAVELDRISVT
ncbi:MAG: GPW/gp25 family protein [Pseudomonadota bacterium]